MPPAGPRGGAPDRRTGGFTLLEVVVAASIAVIMLTALLRVFGSVWDLTGRVREEAAAIVVAQAVLETSMQRTSLAEGASAGRTGDYGWSVQISAVNVPQPERPETAAARRPTSILSQDEDDAGNSDEDPAAAAREEWNWQLFRIQVAVLSPSGRTTNLETLRLAENP